MKLYAIVSESGAVLDGASKTELAAWDAEFQGAVDVEILKENGYRCIELHTYDPEKQVVVDKQVYRNISEAIELYGQQWPETRDKAKLEFLKAGEMK